LANYKAATQAMIELLEAEKAELQAENERQKQQLIEAAPKVDFYNAVTESKDCIDMAQVAKLLNVKGIGRNNLIEILKEKGVLDKKKQPYQKYVDRGYFRVIETPYSLPDGTQRINLKTVVFQKGVDFIHKVIKQNLK
jgi:phage antirepressor YoqD-like protein